MANRFIREPIENGDLNVWADYELPQNQKSEGINTCYLYNDAGALKLSTGIIGINDGTNRGVIIIDTVTTVNIAGGSVSLWGKVEISVSGTSVTIAASNIAGSNDAAALSATFKSAYRGDRGGFYITATKRTIGLYWKNAGGTLEGIVNCKPFVNGWIGYCQSNDASDIPYIFEKTIEQIKEQEGERIYNEPMTLNQILTAQKRIIGGFGASSTGGTLDWNDISNAKSGNGYTLLYGDAANGPGAHVFFHVFCFEFTTKNGTGNLIQFAIPYSTSSLDSGLYMRARYDSNWTVWCRVISTDTSGNIALPAGKTLSGSVTFSGNNVHSGNNTFSGSNTFSNDTNIINAAKVNSYKTNEGGADILLKTRTGIGTTEFYLKKPITAIYKKTDDSAANLLKIYQDGDWRIVVEGENLGAYVKYNLHLNPGYYQLNSGPTTISLYCSGVYGVNSLTAADIVT